MFNFLTSPGPGVYESDNYVVVDFETDTSHGDFGHPVYQDNELLLACWKHGSGGPVLASWGNEYSEGVDRLIEAINKADFVVAHNAKYELGWLIRAGLNPRTVLVFDTKIAEYVLLGNLAAGDGKNGVAPRSTSLDQCVRRRGGPIKDPVTDLLLAHGHNPVTFPRPWLQGRCEQDVRTTEQLFLSQRTALQEHGAPAAALHALRGAARRESSARAAQIMVENGFQSVTPILGGLAAWQDAGYPIEP